MDNRLALKASTHTAHQGAESVWFGEHGFGDRARYMGWLQRMYTIHRDLGVPASCALGQGDFEQDRLSHLQSDLDRPAEPSGGGLPMDPSRAWGIQYVLNGSALGAGVILKSGQLGADWPFAYLQSMSDFARSGKLKRFFEALNTAHLDLASARRGAQDVFGALRASGA